MSRPRNEGTAKVQTSFRLPPELLDSLDQVAEARMLGRSKLVELLLMDALMRIEPIDVPLDPAVHCSNCGIAISEHCDVHQIPCCPGKCDAPITPSGTWGQA